MILGYKEFVLEKNLVQSRRDLTIAIFENIDEINPVLEEAVSMVNLGIFDSLTFDNINNLSEEELFENIFQKAKEKFQKAKETIKQKGKQALSDTQKAILKFGGDVKSIIQVVIKQITEAVKKAFEAGKKLGGQVSSKAKERVRKAIGNVKDPKQLSDDIKNAKAMCKSMAAWVMGGFNKEAAQAMVGVGKADESESFMYFEWAITAGMAQAIRQGDIDIKAVLNEAAGGPKIPFISSIAARLNEVEPFKSLYKVKNKVKDLVGTGLEKFSVYATEVSGAPGPYKFIALATIIGILVEMEVKDLGKKFLKFALHGIPLVGTVISWAATVAKYLAYIAIIETLLAEVQGEAKPAKSNS